MDRILLSEINTKSAELSALLPMSLENKDKLDRKFRLEFNYNSNHIEGNTLTYGETMRLLFFDEPKGEHTFRELEEMKASDVALKMIKDFAAEKERPLTEMFIKYLNEVLLVRPYWSDAITPDGQHTRREILIGDYKKNANSVRLQNGEMFHYASPQETPALMTDLIDWYRAELEKGELHPVELAAVLHYRFVRIHPFDDGNGRVSRLLMNYVLYYFDYPPVVIKSEDKPAYLRALHDADAGDINSFINYIARQLIWSLDLSILAASGKDIEEQSDWKKKLKVLKTNLDTNEAIKTARSVASIEHVITETIIPLTKRIQDELTDVYELFLNVNAWAVIKNRHHYLQDLTDAAKGVNDAENKAIMYRFRFETFNRNGPNTFDIWCSLLWSFNEYTYDLQVINTAERVTDLIRNKLYHQNYTEDEQQTVVDTIAKIVINGIEQELKK